MTFAIILIALALLATIALTIFCIGAIAHLDKRLRLTHDLIEERVTAADNRIRRLEARAFVAKRKTDQ